jgi:hypothetical protein
MTQKNPSPEYARLLRAVRGLEISIREAVAKSKLAYEFNANSYNFACMNACLAADVALAHLEDALTELVDEKNNHDADRLNRFLSKIERGKGGH